MAHRNRYNVVEDDWSFGKEIRQEIAEDLLWLLSHPREVIGLLLTAALIYIAAFLALLV